MVSFWRIALCCVWLSLSACGYSFRGSGSVLPPDVRRIYIPTVENTTTEATLTPLITEALRDQFDRFGAVSVVDTIGEADAVLTTKVISLRRSTNTSTAETDTTLQQDTILTLAAELKRVSGGALWRNPRLVLSSSYGTTANSVVTSSAGFAGGSLSARDLAGLDSHEVSRGQERAALSDMADEVAKRIYEEAVAPDF